MTLVTASTSQKHSFFFVCSSVQASWQSSIFLPTYWNGEVLSLEEMILEGYPDFMGHSSFKYHLPQDFTKKIHKKARVCFQAHFYHASFLAPSSQGPRLHHCTVAAIKAAFNLHILDKPAVGEWVWQGTTVCWLLFRVRMLSWVLQEPPDLVMIFYVASLAGIKVIEVLHEDWSLWMLGCRGFHPFAFHSAYSRPLLKCDL